MRSTQAPFRHRFVAAQNIPSYRYFLPILISLLLALPFTVQALDYYWVNGSGSWSDFANHWATDASGTSFHPNVPTAGDKVIFTNNGGTAYTVFVDASTTVPKCLDMDWSAVPNGTTLDGSATGRLDIYGSLLLHAGMNITFPGETHFIAFGSANTITSNGVHFAGDVFFEGTVGGWGLNDAFFADGYVTHNGGTLVTNNHPVTIWGHFYGNPPGKLELGSSVFTGTAGTFYFRYDPADFDAGTSHIILNSNGYVEGVGNKPTNTTFYDVTFTYSNPLGFAYGNVDGTLKFEGFGRLHGYQTNGIPAVLNNVIFEDDGIIYNAFDYNHLTLTAGKTYTINGQYTSYGTDQTILPGGSLTVNSGTTCNDFITIKSWIFGTPVEFVNNSGNDITVTGVALEDIHTSGTDAFINDYGINVSNNTGWTFTNECPGIDLYWIGGPGDWDDFAHWSLTSGGATCNCLPNQTNNVIFDENSGFSADVNDNEVVQTYGETFCRDMDWRDVTGNPKFQNGGHTFIYGSMYLAPTPEMTYNLTYPIRFRGSNSQVNHVLTAGQTFPHANYYFEGEGEYQLDDGWNAPPCAIFHSNGILKLMGHTHYLWSIFGNQSIQNTLGSPNSELWMGDPASNASATFYCDATVHSCCVPYFRVNYGAGKFHAMESHVIFDGGHANVDRWQSTIAHDLWNVSFLNLPQGSKGGALGNFRYHNILNKLTYTGPGKAYIDGPNSFINELYMETDGIIVNDHDFNIVTLSGGKAVQINGNSTLTISASGSWNTINADCGNRVYLSTDRPNNPATIAKAGGSLNLDYAILDNVLPDLTTGASYSAINSIGVQSDVQTAWGITNPVSRNLYWVDGSGEWHDAAHWSLSSGGTGGECPPTPSDNVFFDANSGLGAFDIVFIKQDWAMCHDMDWTGSSGVLANFYPPADHLPYSQNLAIHGSLTFTPNMVNDFDGNVYLKDSLPATITSGGNHFKTYLKFWESNGDWTLADDLYVDVVVEHWYGHLNTNNKDVTIGSLWSGWPHDNNKPASINLGSTKMTILSIGQYNYGRGEAYFYYSASDLDAGTSSIIFEDNLLGILYGYNFGAELFDVTFKAANSQLSHTNIANKLIFQKKGIIYNGTGNTIHEAEFWDDMELRDSRKYHKITFAPGKRYTFLETYTQTIIPHNGTEGEFNAQGLPGQYIELKSTNPDSPAFIHMDDLDTNSTCTKYLFLTGMTKTGTEEIYVPTPGGNVYNSTGWQFFPCNPCPASIPELDSSSVTVVCPPNQATLILADLQADEWANWYTDSLAMTDLVYSGGNLFQPTISGDTTFYARVYSDGALCESTVILTVNITTDTLPTVFNVTGGGVFCAGNPSTDVGLDGSETGVEYQLLLDGSPTGSPLVGTGSALSFGLQYTTGTYTVGAYISGAACDVDMSGSAVLSVDTLPLVAASYDSLACVGSDTLMLYETGGEAVSWDWSGPAGFTSTDQNPTIPNPINANAGTYVVVVTGAGGCTNSDTVEVSFGSGFEALCQDITVHLDSLGQGIFTAEDIDNGSYDDCGPVWLAISHNCFYCNDIGENIVTLTVTNSAGATDTCTSVVTVPDYLVIDSIVVTPTTCAVPPDGAIAIHVSTPYPSYHQIIYSIDGGSNWTTNNVFTNLPEGTYDVEVQILNAALCHAADTATVEVGPGVIVPTVFNVTGGGTFCIGDSGAAIGLDGSETGVEYQLLLDGNPIGTPLNGTGAALSFGIQNVSGTYTVNSVYSGASCDVDMSGSAVLTIELLPTVLATCDSLHCLGNGPLGLYESGGDAVSWSWTGPNGFSSTDQNPVIPYPTFPNSGTYEVVATGANGCTDSDEVDFSYSSVPVALCQDITVELNEIGQVIFEPEDVDNGSYDDCGPVWLSLSHDCFYCNQIGPNNVTLKVTNAVGAMDSCVAVVTVADYLVIDSLGITATSCPGEADGSITVSASSPYPSYHNLIYSIDGGGSWSSSNHFANLLDSTYYIEVQIANAALCLAADTAIVPVGLLQVWYKDADGDGHSDGQSATSCTQPAQYYLADDLTATSGDCDDGNPDIHAGAPEICNGLDDDCNGQPEAPVNTWTNGGDGQNWSDPANWSDGIEPLPCQDVVIPGSFNVLIPFGCEALGKTLQVMLNTVLETEGTVDIKN